MQMLRFIENAFYAVTKTRMHVAFIFFFLMISLTKLYGGAEKVGLAAPVAFAVWIFALYLFDRVHDINKDELTEKKDTFSPQVRRGLLIFSILLAFAPFVLLCLGYAPIWPALILFPITFLYTIPVYKGIRAKDIFIVKNLYSALLIYTLPVFFVIYVYNGYGGNLADLAVNLGYLLLFVFTGEVIWDIKDIDTDREHGVRTFPAIYGLEKTRIAILTLLLSICIYAFYFGKGINVYVMIGFMLFTLLVKKETPVWVYHLPMFVLLFFQCKNFFGW